MVEFVSYTGKWPCLCAGDLTIMIDGEMVELSHALTSGGSVWFDEDWSEHVEDGPWAISACWCDLPQKYHPLIPEIEKVVNDNVPWGCCGGCV